MSRIKVDIPKTTPLFQTEIQISIDQINYGGHVGNDRYMAIMHEARLRWFKSLGYRDEVSIKDQIAIFVVDAACEFTGEMFHGDLIKINLYISDRHKYGFDLIYQFTNEEKETVFKGKTGLLSVDMKRKKAVTFPEEFWTRAGIG